MAHRPMQMAHRLVALVAVLVPALVLSTDAIGAKPREAAIVVDHATGEVLYARNADRPVYPASLTKMMTLYMLFDELDSHRLSLSSRLPVSGNAAAMPASKLGLRRGSSISVEMAIPALIAKSANDVAVVVAEALSGSEERFAEEMTAKARRLGLRATVFRNASGLPHRYQKTTARDMALLARRLIIDHADKYAAFAVSGFSYNGRTYRTYNRLLARYSGMDGLKTGYIRASGFNLAGSALRDGRRLVAVMFGGRSAASRDRAFARLLDRGFDEIRRRPVVVVGPPAARPSSAPTAVALTPEPSHGLQMANITVPTRHRPVRRPERTIPVVISGASHAMDTGTRRRIELPASSTTRTAANADPGGGTAAAATSVRLDIGASKKPAEGAYGVQLGAYLDADLARRAAFRALRRLPDPLLQGDVLVSARDGRNGPVFRARVVGFERATADDACRRLRAVEQDCLVFRSDMQLAAIEGNA